MSEDFVNQLTLNCLINKNQLKKLHKKSKEDNDKTKQVKVLFWKDRLIHLFTQLIKNDPPDDLLFEVTTIFESFVDKSIYYFEAHDNSIKFESERNNNEINDDIDYDKDELAIERGDYEEYSKNDDEPDEEQDEEQDEDEDEDEEHDDEPDEDKDKEQDEDEDEDDINKKIENKHPVVVKHKYHKKNNSIGVDDIQKLPLDWFQNMRYNYKKNQIIPRKKDIIFEEQTFRVPKKKI